MTASPAAKPGAYLFAQQLGLDGDLAIEGAGGLGGSYPVSHFAAASVAATALALADLVGSDAQAAVSMPLVDGWFRAAVRPREPLPGPWDPLARDYRTADGWIRLHTNAPAHKAALLSALGLAADADREAVAAVVLAKRADELESEIVFAGGCAAALRTAGAWSRHPQGVAVAAEPLVAVEVHDEDPVRPIPLGVPERPLAGVRVLDLTRVLAGPVATRALAMLGADVLRIDPPGWNEPALEPDMTLGKRCARLDAHSVEGRAELLALLAEADVLVHGYRPGALDSIGLDAATRRTVRPGLVEVQISAYGYSGPWAARRGFDSLVQMSAGIADRGMRELRADAPTWLPVQALDHATGWLAAAAALRGIATARRSGAGSISRLSLARTAHELERWRTAWGGGPFPQSAEGELPSRPLDTPWGTADVLESPLELSELALETLQPPRRLGSEEPLWAAQATEAGDPRPRSSRRAALALSRPRLLAWAASSAAATWALQGLPSAIGGAVLGASATVLPWWTTPAWAVGALAQALVLAAAWMLVSRIATIGVAATAAVVLGYAAHVVAATLVLQYGMTGLPAETGAALLTVGILTVSTAAAFVGVLLPALLLFTPAFLGRVDAGDRAVRVRYRRR